MSEIRTGDRVRIKTAGEIAKTLDPDGRLYGLPFMPEMLAYCSQEFTVSRSAHKTCDTVLKTGGRRLTDTVHLADLRCDGTSHGGCEAHCLLFWKTQWLEEIGESSVDTRGETAPVLTVSEARDGTLVYQCQATKLPEFSELLPWWNLQQYWQDVRSGNESLKNVAATAVLQSLRNLMDRAPGYRFWLAFHNRIQAWVGGVPLEASMMGSIPNGEPTPVDNLNLQVGELVEIRTYDEIRTTLSTAGKNRGMRYDIEMLPHSGRQARVARRVTKIINEQTGEMLDMKTPCIVLEGVYCESRYSPHRLFCPRRLPSFWRESWLKRVSDGGDIPVTSVTEGSDGG